MRPATASFALSAAIAILFNTALAWAKDISPPLNDWMKSVAGHHWTTHGLADLLVFLGLGLIFLRTGVAQRINPARIIDLLVGSVVVASLGLVLWFALV